MDQRIVDFLKETIVAVIAVQSNEGPYCFSCFFAFDEKDKSIIFKSSENSAHCKFMQADKRVSGCINGSDVSVAHLKGIQFNGECFSIESENQLIGTYKNKFPLAVFKSGEYWKIKLLNIKFTDNRLGFGTKIIWTCIN